MSASRRIRRQHRFVPEHQRPPVGRLNADQLHRELVEDAVRWSHATDLIRFTEACIRIGELRRCGAEEAFKAVTAEVEAKRGAAGMPLG